MKKLLLLLCCITAFSLSGQNNWQWALAPDSAYTSINSVEGMAIDNNDNVFITGIYGQALAIAGTTLAPPNVGAARCGYIAKINKNGLLQWMQRSETGNQTSVCTDGVGNSYVIGAFGGSMAVSGTTLNGPPNDAALFLLKFSATGSLIWGKIIGTGISVPKSIKRMGNKLYISGYHSYTTTPTNFTIGSYSFAALPKSNLFYAQLDTAGMVLNANRFGGFYPYYRTSLAPSQNGNITLNAYADGAALVIGTQTLTATATSTNLSSEILININAVGTVNWAKRIKLAETYINSEICSDPNSNIYFVTSVGGGSVAVDNFTIAQTNTSVCGLLLKFDAAGTPLWGSTFESVGCGGPYGAVTCSGVDVDKNGNLSVCGVFSGQTLSIGGYTANTAGNSCTLNNVFIAQFDWAGNPVGVIFNTASNVKPNPNHILVDNDGNVLIGGFFYNSKFIFGTSTLSPNPANVVQRLFVAKTGGIINGISANSPANPITVYPIPSTSELIFTSENNRIRNIMLYDLTGKLVATKYCDNIKVELSIAELAPGIYNARIETQDGYVKSLKVVKSE